MRSCYICRKKAAQAENISLHRFPKTLEMRKKWVEACGLHEKDDVSHLYICSHHFKLPGNLVRTEKWRLPPGAVPERKLRGQKLFSVYRPNTEDSTNITAINNITTSPEIPVEDYSTIELPNISIMKSTNISELPEAESTSSTTFELLDCANTVQPVLEASTSHSYSEESLSSPPKKHFFTEPRYISEITVSDISMPKRTRGVIDFVKKTDKDKRKQIKSLQYRNRKLLMRIDTLYNFMTDLKESRLISDDD